MKEETFWEEMAPSFIVILLITGVLVYLKPMLSILGIIGIIIVFFHTKKKRRERAFLLAKHMEELTQSIERATFYALKKLPVAIAVFDSSSNLRWRNQMCEDFFGGDEGDSIEEVFPDISMEEMEHSEGEFLYSLEGKIYNVYHSAHCMNGEEDAVTLVYVSDVTNIENFKRKFSENRIVVAYLQFDNYNNVLKGLSDSQRENVKAEVNKLVGAWSEEIHGVYRQYTDDMYFVVLHRHWLDEEIKKKFDILDRFRSIKVGNKLPITFSIGISSDGENIVDIGAKAQSCLDMALGRGGDQVTVSVDETIHFFGGITMAQEKNTRVGARSAAHVIKEIMNNAERIFVTGHINEDFDSIGAAVGVAKMAMLIDKPVYIIISGQEGVSVAKFKELVADYEEYKDVLLTDEEASKMVEPGSLLILVDHHRPMLCAAQSLLDKISNKIIIDHHRRAEDFIADATFIYHEPAASSTCELVTELLMYFDDNVEFNRMEASILYAGIAVDSKNFAVQTGARTFGAAATLRLAGADPTMVRHLFSEDIELVKTRAKLLSSAEIFHDGICMSYGVLPDSGKSSIAVAQAADTMLNMEGVKASFVLGQLGDEVIVSARSTGKINVQLIMEELGGGGHQTVAGVKIKSIKIEDLKTNILELVKKQIEESEGHESDSATR